MDVFEVPTLGSAGGGRKGGGRGEDNEELNIQRNLIRTTETSCTTITLNRRNK